MKALKGILSAAAALTIAVCSIPASASAVTINSCDLRNISEYEAYCASQHAFDTMEEAAAHVKNSIIKREPKVTFTLPSDYDYEEVCRKVIKMSFAETDKGNEGDYIRMGLKEYKCGVTIIGPVTTYVFEMKYRTTLEQEQYVDQKVAEIIKSLDMDNDDDYTKLKKIYEYIIRNVKYDYDSKENEVFSAYGALYNHKAVCQGISQLFYRLAKDVGVGCRMIRGDAGGPHAWNIASVNGVYYICDATWDLVYENVEYCDFFLKGSKDLDDVEGMEPHIADGGDEAKSPYNVNYDSKEFRKKYPISLKKYDPSDPDVELPVPEYTVGDVNGDSLVDSSDASMILVAYANVSVGKDSGLSEIQEMAADVNYDDAVDASDASDVLRYYAYVSTGGTDEPDEFFK